MAEQKHKAYYLTNLTIYDGTGKPGFTGDILISGSRIQKVKDVPDASIPEEAVRVDCKGYAAAPGFIDAHSHSDRGLLLHPGAECLIRQGITTTVGGNCGSSSAGLDINNERSWRQYKEADIDRWDGMKGFLDTVDKVHPAVNIAMLAGHGDFRRALAGDSGRPLTAEEKGQMKSFAAKALTDGAFGISSGLEYVPGRFADVDELASVSAGIVAFGGIHASHIRNEGPMLLESIDELVAVAKQSGARIEISHLKSCGPDNWGKVAKVLEVFDTENVKGIDISSDFYPYLASSTGLSIVLPDWVLEQGRQAAIEILLPYKRIFESGQKSLADLESDTAKKACTESNARTLVQGGWDKIVITSIKNPEDKWMEGLNVEEVSLKLELPAAETAMGILARNNIDVGIARHAMSEDDLISVMKHPRSCVVTDGSVSIPSKGKIHPRSIGTYPRLFGRYVKELGVLSVEEAVRKCTSLPASKIGLKDRGILSEDKMADIIIFDPDTIAEKSTYQDPWQYPVGIFALFVNGSPVIWEGNVTGKRPGKALRRS